MYTDYDSEIYFLTDTSLSPDGINSTRPLRVPLFQTAEQGMDTPGVSGLSLGHVQQPDTNTQPKGDLQ